MVIKRSLSTKFKNQAQRLLFDYRLSALRHMASPSFFLQYIQSALAVLSRWLFTFCPWSFQTGLDNHPGLLMVKRQNSANQWNFLLFHSAYCHQHEVTGQVKRQWQLKWNSIQPDHVERTYLSSCQLGHPERQRWHYVSPTMKVLIDLYGV